MIRKLAALLFLPREVIIIGPRYRVLCTAAHAYCTLTTQVLGTQLLYSYCTLITQLLGTQLLHSYCTIHNVH